MRTKLLCLANKCADGIGRYSVHIIGKVGGKAESGKSLLEAVKGGTSQFLYLDLVNVRQFGIHLLEKIAADPLGNARSLQESSRLLIKVLHRPLDGGVA